VDTTSRAREIGGDEIQEKEEGERKKAKPCSQNLHLATHFSELAFRLNR